METKTVKIAQRLTESQVAFCNRMIDQGGPEEKDYQRLSLLVDTLDEEGTEELRDILSPLLNNLESTLGFANCQPHGYAGDFEIIEKIYSKKVLADVHFQKWDIWFQKSYAAMAVRNRKDFFTNLMSELESKDNSPKEVLILGSGPATDVYEYLKKNPDSNLTFDLVDLDQDAINYATEKTQEVKDKVNFFRINVLRFKTHKHYDMIWSAGLFDYFKEKHFIYLMKKYSAFLSPKGEMVIGNFSKYNPTRKLQEALLGWYLNYRSDYELYKMAIDAGFEEDQVMIAKEPLGVNLFLRIKLDKQQFTTYNKPLSNLVEYSVN